MVIKFNFYFTELFLKNGADPNSTDDKGITPLHLSAYKGQDDNVEILLKYKSNPNLKDIMGSNNIKNLKLRNCFKLLYYGRSNKFGSSFIRQ